MFVMIVSDIVTEFFMDWPVDGLVKYLRSITGNMYDAADT